MGHTSRRTITFQSERTVDVVESPIPTPRSSEIRVRTLLSAVSPGTELLVYRGEAPTKLPADKEIDALSSGLEFPLSYGYAAVGEVEACGANVSDNWLGTRVFAFQPHTSHFVTAPSDVVVLPDHASLKDGVMIPNVETAVNLTMDGHPVIGERVVIFGQGVVGLLTTELMSRHPITCYTVEPHPSRRALSEEKGATQSFPPTDESDALHDALNIGADQSDDASPQGADLTYELTGNPSVLDEAIAHTGFDGRVVIGSWYGTKEAPLNLGGRFHRSRITLLSSQVSTVASEYQGRWTKARRLTVVCDLLESLHPGTLISDTFSIEEAPSVYRALDKKEDRLLQPVFEYL